MSADLARSLTALASSPVGSGGESWLVKGGGGWKEQRGTWGGVNILFVRQKNNLITCFLMY